MITWMKIAAVIMLGAVYVRGSGLESNGVGPRSRSMGFAMVTAADDWSVVHFNPAGAAMISENIFGGEYEYFTGGMSCTASLRNLGPGLGDPMRGDFTDPAGDEPSSFSQKEVTSVIHFGAFGFVSGNRQFSWGAGLYGSGSGTSWNDSMRTGTGDTVRAELAFTNGSAKVPLVCAWKVRPDVCLGVTFGFHWGLLTAENTKIRTGAAFPYTMDTVQDTQGTALSLDFGVLWKAREDISLGTVLKFPYTFRKSGDTETEQSLLSLSHKTHTVTKMKYPLRIALGGSWDVSERDLLAFGLTWLNWDRYRLLIDYNDEIPGVLEDYSGNPGEWENTVRLHAGYERVLDERWSLRIGLTYDQAPEPEEYRTLIGGQVVDAWLLTAGAGAHLGTVRIDFGYIYTYGPEVEGYIPDAEYSMTLHEVFAGMVKRF